MSPQNSYRNVGEENSDAIYTAPNPNGTQLEESSFFRRFYTNYRGVLIFLGWFMAILFISLYATTSRSAAVTPTNPNLLSLSIFAFNDCYELHPVAGRGGMARFATVLNQARKQLGEDHVLTLMAGDFLSPSALSTAVINDQGESLNGKQMVDLFNILKVDYVAYGNHEFDLADEDMRKRLQESKFPYLGINVRPKDDTKPLPNTFPYAFVERAGMKIAIIGLVVDSPPKAEVLLDDYAATVVKVKNLLAQWKTDKKQYDILIGLTHQAYSDDERLAKDVPEFDIILGGHEHDNWFMNRGTSAHPLPIAKADANLKTYFRHDLVFDKVLGHASGVSRTGAAYNAPGSLKITSTLLEINDKIASEPHTQAACDRWRDIAFQAFDHSMGIRPRDPMAKTDVAFDARDSTTRSELTEIGKLIANAMMHDMKSQHTNNLEFPSFFNAGSIRMDDILNAGCLYNYDALRLLPFGGKTHTIRASGTVLLRALRGGTDNRRNGGWINWDNKLLTRDEQTQKFKIDGVEIPNDDTLFFTVNVPAYMVDPKVTTYFEPNTFDIVDVSQNSIQKAVINYFGSIYPPAPCPPME